MIYTLICYRPNGADYCRGCEMGRSDSDHAIQSTIDKNEIVKLWAEKLLENHIKTREFSKWEITLFVNGIGFNSNDITDEESILYNNEQVEIESFANQFFLKLKEKHEKQEADRKMVEEAERSLDQNRKDYNRYLELKSKFERGNTK